jgi:hypothetical protein
MIQGSELTPPVWARDLARLDDDEIRSRLAGLSAREQATVLLSLPWADRLRVVRNSDRALDLVRVLPDEEILLTIKGAGIEDSLSLVALTTPAQLRFILDVELWKRDAVDGDKARQWLGYILSCGEAKVIEFAETADRELLTIVLSRLIGLIPNEEGVKPPEGLTSIMSDQFFTILSRIPEETESIRLLLRILRHHDRDEFYKILFDVHGCLGAETEENAYRWRASRLEEKGLLEFGDAIEIYGYIGEDEARTLAAGGSWRESEEGPGMAPTYPMILTKTRTFFYEILTSVEDDNLANRLRAEIAFSANRLLVADAHEIGEIESMRKALKRLFALTNLGLLFLAGADRREALRVLSSVPVKEIFQVGFSRVADLKTSASDIASRWWPMWGEDGFVFLGHPKDEIMRCLLMRVPQYSPHSKGAVDSRDFETLEEVDDARRVIEEIEVVARTCFGILGIPQPHEAKPVLDGVFTPGIEAIDFGKLVITGFVNFMLKGDFDISPLSRRDLKGLFEDVLETGASGERLVKQAAAERFLCWLADKVSCGERDWGIFQRFFMEQVRSLNQDLGAIPSWENLDPRYVRSLIFRRWSQEDER